MRLRHALLALSLVAAAPAAAQDAPTSVIELFTSQGCSSCPPADRLAREISLEGRALVLTLPVDYWDYLGWKDTLANPANSARQRAYAMARADRKVFTPQIVVNGRDAAVGGDRGAVEAALRRAGAGALAVPVAVSAKDGRLAVEIGAAPAGASERRAEVWAFAVERERSVEIGRGENEGRSVTYANVVRHMTRLGAWDGQAARFEIAAADLVQSGGDGLAVLVQAGSGGRPGPIVGAARVDVPQQVAPAATATRMSRVPY